MSGFHQEEDLEVDLELDGRIWSGETFGSVACNPWKRLSLRLKIEGLGRGLFTDR
jgi:hypothetical protein